MCTGPLFPISSYSALFIPLKPSFLGKGHQSSIICIIFIKILQIFFPILSTSLKIGIQITLCRKMWLLSRSALAQRSSSLLLRSASLSTPLLLIRVSLLKKNSGLLMVIILFFGKNIFINCSLELILVKHFHKNCRS